MSSDIDSDMSSDMDSDMSIDLSSSLSAYMSEDYPRKMRITTRRSQRSRRSVKEFEAEVNLALLEECKVDACIDKFLAQLEPYYPIKRGLPDFEEGCPSKIENTAFEEMNHQLYADLHRLAPQFLSEHAKNGSIEWNSIRYRIRRRRYAYKQSHREYYPTDESWEELVGTLAELNYRQLMTHLQPQEQGRGSSLLESAFWESCRQLKQVVEGENSSASFVCGGVITIATTGLGKEKLAKKTSPPVKIFWASPGKSHARKVVLPLKESADSNLQILQQLVKDCAPVTTKCDLDKIDPNYLKVGEMDSDNFATSFDLAKFGILEFVERILYPAIEESHKINFQSRKLSAELCKLNAYSGRTSVSCREVGTSRSSDQVGTLVVCLPSQFSGGNLIVRRCGQDVHFDWSPMSASTIQSAAFYSDCEHEIKAISKGTRLTLIYDLYIREEKGDIFLPNAIVDYKTLPIYGYVKSLVEEPGFMKDGGVLGIFCSHKYEHSKDCELDIFSRHLKGSDLVLYSVFKSLGIEVSILPVIDIRGQFAEGNRQLGTQRASYSAPRDTARCEEEEAESLSGFEYDKNVPMLTLIKEYLSENEYDLMIENLYDSQFQNCEDVDTRWKVLAMQRRIMGMARFVETAKQEGLDTTGLSYQRAGARVGRSLYQWSLMDDPLLARDQENDESLRELWPFFRLPGITWLTEPKHRQMAFTYTTWDEAYGGDVVMESRLSCASLFAIIPPYEKRANMGGPC